MSSIRINMSLLKRRLKNFPGISSPRKRSRFITQAVKRSLKEIKKQRLAAEYEEAAVEIHRVNQELEGTLSDGLD